ncbi:MAG: GlsB/YeaQ/YmgE family stress response membrane protein [Acidobacteriia bacterium]|nr:GlsB/YeaQ/YmgE family stress response membrane protein [Terriglobia bacterium]
MFSTLFEERTFVFGFHHGLLGWLLIGLLAGWLAGKLSHGHGYGCFTNVTLGLIGAVLGGWIFWKLGIFGGGFLYSLAAATLGAVLLVAIARLFAGPSS